MNGVVSPDCTATCNEDVEFPVCDSHPTCGGDPDPCPACEHARLHYAWQRRAPA